jgi:hypothetical protein
MRWCNWCNINLGEQEHGKFENGSWFHEACHSVYVRNKGKPLGRLLHLPSIPSIKGKCADEK